MSGPGHVRLFLALDLPDSARRALAEWHAGAIAGQKGLREVAPEALHVTLAFLGARERESVPEIWNVASRACDDFDAPLLAAEAIHGVPLRRPGLFALGLADTNGLAGRLQDALAGALTDAGLFEPETRPFWPHVTLARVRERDVRAPRIAWGAPPELSFHAAGVTLYRSDNRPDGVRYTALERLSLEPAEGR